MRISMEGHASYFVLTCLFLLLLSLTYITRYNLLLCSSSLAQDLSSCLHSSKDFPIPNNTTIVKSTRKVRHLERVEYGLARARLAIREAARTRTYGSSKDGDFLPSGSIYLNPHAFHQSHREMEKRFRIWVYKEGQAPIFHKGPLNDIYAIEGQWMEEFESGMSPFLAKHPMDAISFFLPISVVNIVLYVYRPYTDYSRLRLQNIFQDYIRLISLRYPFWNQTGGADHFMLSCHDWAPDVSAANPELFKHLTRVLCNANTSEGFQPTRDVSLPEIKIPYGGLGPPFMNKPASNRTILAFFAGGAHGAVRETLFRHWKNKGKDVQVHEYLPKTANYSELMGESRYCLCPSGYEVASPRVVEAIYAACVPVIISDHYVLPFSDVLNWTQFSIHIPTSEIPKMKEILEGISMEEFLQKQEKVIQVRRHFVVHRPAKSYDLMHMVMHSVWLRRLNIRFPPSL
ncbi:hypothetical protein K1719_010655 [Acacia pycnantha]|nr:hypothetical protein K1719_010655 [Acacia pycnantha]